MVRDGEVFFLDFGDAFFSDDFALDILSKGWSTKTGWRTRRRSGSSRRYTAAGGYHGSSNLFNAPAMQYVVYSILGVATCLSSLVSKYGCITAF